MDNIKKITAVIPVRKGSTRCKNKNIRNNWIQEMQKMKREENKITQVWSESQPCQIIQFSSNV